VGVKFSNNAATTLTSGISNVATSMTVDDPSPFPTIGGADYCYLTLVSSTAIEIVKATALSGSVFTIVRAQDGTSGVAFDAADVVELRVTLLGLDEAYAAIDVVTGTNTGDNDPADLTTAGIIEVATVAEGNVGTDATRAMSPAGLAGWIGHALITALGTIATGVWNGTAIAVGYGGTGSGTASGARTNLGLGTAAVENVAAMPAQTLAGAVTGAAQLVSNIELKDTAETVVAKGDFGATPAWDVSAGNVQWGTHSEIITSSTMTDWPADTKNGKLELEVNGGADYAFVWPTSVQWQGDVVPTLTAGKDVFVFKSRDAGVTVIGYIAGLDM